MKKLFVFILVSSIFLSCKKTEVPATKPSINPEIKPVKYTCDKYVAESTLKKYLLDNQIIEYPGQVEFKSVQINDNCDFRISATFYLENLVSGDGIKDFRVSFDGQKYFVN